MSGLELLLIPKAIAFFKAHAAVTVAHQAATTAAAHVPAAVAHNAAIQVAHHGVAAAVNAPTATEAATTIAATGAFAYGIASQKGGYVGIAQRMMDRHGIGNPAPVLQEVEDEDPIQHSKPSRSGAEREIEEDHQNQPSLATSKSAQENGWEKEGPEAGVQVNLDKESFDPNPPTCRGFRSPTMRWCYLTLGALQICVSLALLVLTAFIIDNQRPGPTPLSADHFFLIFALYSFILACCSMFAALKKSFTASILLIVLEGLALIFSFSATITITVDVSLNYWTYCNPAGAPSIDIDQFLPGDSGYIWLQVRCHAEAPTVAFFWFSWPLYLGSSIITILTYRNSQKKRDGACGGIC